MNNRSETLLRGYVCDHHNFIYIDQIVRFKRCGPTGTEVFLKDDKIVILEIPFATLTNELKKQYPTA